MKFWLVFINGVKNAWI